MDQEINQESAQDGMDMSLCVIDKQLGTIRFAGAQNSIYLVNNKQITEIKADNLSIGGTILSKKLNGSFVFTTKEVTYQEGSSLFMFTDGYMDQFGGEGSKKLNKSKFKDLLCNLASDNLKNAKERAEEYLLHWMGQNVQVDDILLIGARL
jgi:serine phosphatase RsbU (regulator of sigma subunit)